MGTKRRRRRKTRTKRRRKTRTRTKRRRKTRTRTKKKTRARTRASHAAQAYSASPIKTTALLKRTMLCATISWTPCTIGAARKVDLAQLGSDAPSCAAKTGVTARNRARKRTKMTARNRARKRMQALPRLPARSRARGARGRRARTTKATRKSRAGGGSPENKVMFRDRGGERKNFRREKRR